MKSYLIHLTFSWTLASFVWVYLTHFALYLAFWFNIFIFILFNIYYIFYLTEITEMYFTWRWFEKLRCNNKPLTGIWWCKSVILLSVSLSLKVCRELGSREGVKYSNQGEPKHSAEAGIWTLRFQLHTATAGSHVGRIPQTTRSTPCHAKNIQIENVIYIFFHV